jgi:hypothetical protein
MDTLTFKVWHLCLMYSPHTLSNGTNRTAFRTKSLSNVPHSKPIYFIDVFELHNLVVH